MLYEVRISLIEDGIQHSSSVSFSPICFLVCVVREDRGLALDDVVSQQQNRMVSFLV